MTRSPHHVVAIVQARMGSTRLPGKVMLPLGGEPILFHMIERLRICKRLDNVMIATTTGEEDGPILEFARRHDVSVHRGPRDDVLERYVGAMNSSKATIVVRITSDCPFIDPATVDEAVSKMLDGDIRWDCVNVGVGGGYPRGLDCEVMSKEALLESDRLAKSEEEREHVSLFLLRRRDKFRVKDLQAPRELSASRLRLVVDEVADYNLADTIYTRLYRPKSIVDVRAVIELLKQEPALSSINSHVQQKHPQAGETAGVQA